MSLRQLLQRPGILVAPGVYDGLTATLAAQAGFEALYLSGAAVAYTRLGRPDIGLTSVTEMADTMALIRDRVPLPVIIDADTGFGNALNAQRTMRLYERAGADALQVEDQTSPKRCGHLSDKSLIPPAEMAGKIKGMADARASDETLIIARTDAIAVEGFDAAIARAETYAEAGADVLFIEAPRSGDELARVADHFRGRIPLLANMVEGGATPITSATDLERLGFRRGDLSRRHRPGAGALRDGILRLAARARLERAVRGPDVRFRRAQRGDRHAADAGHGSQAGRGGPVSVVAPPPAHCDLEVETLVIGAGAGGLVAALAAREAGHEVLVVEADAVPAGSTALSAGLIPAAGTRAQAAAGIDDSPALFARDIQAKAHDENDPALVAALAQVSAEAVDWLASAHGLGFSVVDDFDYPGHSRRRMHGLPSRAGRELVDALRAATEAAGADIVCGRRAEVLFAAGRRVHGAELRRADGGTETVRAQRDPGLQRVRRQPRQGRAADPADRRRAVVRP